jgi:hypothetical protein
MSNLFNADDKNDIINRIDELHPNSKPFWGKMSVSQMLLHCVQPIEVAMGRGSLKQSFLGKLIGKRFKNKMVRDDYQFRKNLPTPKSFVIKSEPDFYISQQTLKNAIEEMFNADKKEMEARPHPFFGKMTEREWGVLAFKHLDHHLKQFGV